MGLKKVIPILNSSSHERDYYCSMKFRYLKIDPTKKLTYNCHAAAPYPVDFKWLSDNPGQLFNTAVNVSERQQMLRNERNISCEQNCWYAEDKGSVSPRMYQGGAERTHDSVTTLPTLVDFTINNDCNLSCSYCCKNFSSTWRRDLLQHGSYQLTDYTSERFVVSDYDRVLEKVSQQGNKQSQHYQALLKELFLVLPGLEELTLTGGEPFLDNSFFDLLSEQKLNPDMRLKVYSGLGVAPVRFKRILEKLSKLNNLLVTVSAENIADRLEFNRYGVTWDVFRENFKALKEAKVKVNIQSTLSALTLLGFAEFADYFSNEDIVISFAYQPRFSAPHVLDLQSKELITKQIQVMPDDWKNKIIDSMSATPTELDRLNLSEFITQFVHRRPNLSYKIFPTHFLEWLNINVV